MWALRLSEWLGLTHPERETEGMELLRLTGEVVSIGDMPADKVPKMAGVPHLLLRLSDGRDIVLSGLTRDECRACVPAFMSPARFSVSAA